jgi:hypothetical protein
MGKRVVRMMITELMAEVSAISHRNVLVYQKKAFA